MGQPDVTDADIELETYLRRTMLTHGTYSTDDIRTRLAAHRQAAVAKREAEIVECIREAERQRFAKCLLEKQDTVGVYFTAGELIDKIQTPRGA